MTTVQSVADHALMGPMAWHLHMQGDLTVAAAASVSDAASPRTHTSTQERVTPERMGTPIQETAVDRTAPSDVPADELVPLSVLLAEESEVPFLVKGPLSLPEGEVTMLYGDSGIGKSFLAYQAAVCVATAMPLLGADTRAGSVLIFDFENRASEIARRISSVAEAITGSPCDLDEVVHIKDWARQGKTLLQLETEAHSLIAKCQPSLIIVDGWQGAFWGDPVDAPHATEASKLLGRLAGEERAVLVLHHVSTGEVKKAKPNPGGNRYIRHFVRGLYFMAPSGALTLVKTNYKLPESGKEVRKREVEGALVFDAGGQGGPAAMESMTVALSGSAKGRPTRAQSTEAALVLDYLQSAGGTMLESDLKRKLSEAWGKSEKTAGRRLEKEPALLPALVGSVIKRVPEGRTHRLTLIDANRRLMGQYKLWTLDRTFLSACPIGTSVCHGITRPLDGSNSSLQ